MERFLVTSSVSAAIYAAVALLIVGVGTVLGDPLSEFVLLIMYVGPVAYFFAVLTKNLSTFSGIRNPALRFVALLSVCAVTSFVVWTLVVILGVNFYLLLGGRI